VQEQDSLIARNVNRCQWKAKEKKKTDAAQFLSGMDFADRSQGILLKIKKRRIF
jgi:hypothetical protein